jgi:hypothetical protein
MNIDMEKQAYDYIMKKGGNIYIYTNSIRGCCGAQTAVYMYPKIEMGKPSEKDIDQYNKINYKDANIYINPKVDQEMVKDKKIKLQRALGIFNSLIFDEVFENNNISKESSN